MPIIKYNRPIVPPGKERRDRYRDNDNYRERVKDSSRKTYRRKFDVLLSNCLHSLTFVDELAQDAKVKTKSGRVLQCKVLNVSRTGLALQVIYQTVWRWIKSEMIPPPVLVSVTRSSKKADVYHVDEVRVFIEEIGNHQKQVKYFRRDHAEVIDRIRKRIAAFRRDNDIEA